ncbi:MAG TPA: phospho-sugar mutase [Clostridiales bacterium]|nr:phospho-sugar mutase [Clostridiales bacterium]
MTYFERYKIWCSSPCFDKKTKEELMSIKGDDKEIQNRFYKELDFGTGGLRGIMGNGSNRMNIYTVRKATQGIANYINNNENINKSIVIAYDSRNMSKEFALETALCFNANGIKTFLFSTLQPTPILSFAVSHLKCTAGIVITASHNPPQYNGYKVYWSDGGQIIPPLDKNIISYVNNIVDYNKIKTTNQLEAMKSGLFNVIGNEVENAFIDSVKKITFTAKDLSKEKSKLKIVYTPLHGAGNVPVQRILKENGYKNVYVVKEQEQPNGDFSTVKSPNPEDIKAFEMALLLAKEKDADIVLATDPDADRLGVYVKDNKGRYTCFNGNMIGSIMAEYILSQMKFSNSIPTNGAIVKTIVTTKMLKAIAESYGVSVVQVLTGFKYIGAKINEFFELRTYHYILGVEESYGYLPGTYVRDKDAIGSVAVLCEMAAYYKSIGVDLCQVMEDMYKCYGYYKEQLFSIALEGVAGEEKIKTIMMVLRQNPPQQIGEYKVCNILDYQEQTELNVALNTKKLLKTNRSNVMYFEMENDSFCCVRPSGTEPKIKIYLGVREKSSTRADEKLQDIKNDIYALFK